MPKAWINENDVKVIMSFTWKYTDLNCREFVSRRMLGKRFPLKYDVPFHLQEDVNSSEKQFESSNNFPWDFRNEYLKHFNYLAETIQPFENGCGLWNETYFKQEESIHNLTNSKCISQSKQAFIYIYGKNHHFNGISLFHFTIDAYNLGREMFRL